MSFLNISLAALACTTALLPFSALAAAGAQDNYLSISGDVSWLDDVDSSNATTGASGNTDFDTGGRVNLALGHRFMPGSMGAFRFEVEGGYHRNELGTTTTSLGGSANPDSTLKVYSYMGNLFYDFTAPNWRFSPYVGAGAGGAYVTLPRTSGLGNSDDHDNTFAYQFMTGLNYTAATMPNTTWSVGYRYFAATDPEFSNVKLDDLRSHNAELGVRFHF